MAKHSYYNEAYRILSLPSEPDSNIPKMNIISSAAEDMGKTFFILKRPFLYEGPDED